MPPGGQRDEQEDQVGGVEVVVEEAVALGGGEGLDLALVVGGAVDLVGRGSAGQAFPLQQAGQFGMGGVVVEGAPGELPDVLQIRSGRGYRGGEIPRLPPTPPLEMADVGWVRGQEKTTASGPSPLRPA